MADEGKVRPPYYWWWRSWMEDGKPYASYHRELSASAAKSKHRAEASFSWAVGKDNPHVTVLWYVDGEYQLFVAQMFDGGGNGIWRDASSGQDWRSTIRVGSDTAFEMPY